MDYSIRCVPQSSPVSEIFMNRGQKPVGVGVGCLLSDSRGTDFLN